VGPEGTAYTSQTGATAGTHFTGTNWLIDVAFGNGLFAGIGVTFEATRHPDGSIASIGALRRDAILTSPDGEHWTLESAPPNPHANGASLTSIAHGAGWFVAVGEHGFILTSRDGKDWSLRDAGRYAVPIPYAMPTARLWRSASAEH
jgi:hypothetical protein